MRGLGGFIVGALVGLGIAGCLGGVVGYSWIKRAEANSRRGWMLVPVVVYAKDLAAGEVAIFDAISQRSVPEQFVTSSVVKPDSASYIVNERIQVPVSAGDPALWSHFNEVDRKLAPEAGSACSAKFPPRAAFKTVAELRKSVEGR